MPFRSPEPPLTLPTSVATVAVDMGTPWEEEEKKSPLGPLVGLLLVVGCGVMFLARPPARPVATVAPTSQPSVAPVVHETIQRAEKQMALKDYEGAARFFGEAEKATRGAELERARAGRVKAQSLWADELLAASSRALGQKDWNGAIHRAEQANELGTGVHKKKARALIDQANRKVAEARVVTADPAVAGPEASATPELPSLGEAPTVPGGRKVGRVAAAPPPPTIHQPEPRSVNRAPQAVPVHRAPEPQPAPRLGEQNVLPGYNSGSRFR